MNVNCGAVNRVLTYDLTSAEIYNCTAPSVFQGRALPVGKHADSLGNRRYNPAQSANLIRSQYIEPLGIDPETALEARRRLDKVGVARLYDCLTPDSKKDGVK